MEDFSFHFSSYRRIWLAGLLGTLVVFLLALFFYAAEIKAPRNFPAGKVVQVSNGANLSDIAAELHAAGVIRSPFWFTNFIIFFNHERTAVSGEYYFERPVSVISVARAVSRGTFNMDQAKTTIPEGSTNVDIANIIHASYPDFDMNEFLSLASTSEGYLFPDTYKFGANVRPARVMEMMLANFDKRIKAENVVAATKTSGYSQKELIIMASILEGEARQTRTRQVVAGILWKRIKIGMPLQVDAAFRVINGKTSAQLTQADLKIDSPYNTYINKGLPPGPISNPGLDSILAAAQPVKSNYLYFLTDANGTMHYAATLEEHAANKRKYLK